MIRYRRLYEGDNPGLDFSYDTIPTKEKTWKEKSAKEKCEELGVDYEEAVEEFYGDSTVSDMADTTKWLVNLGFKNFGHLFIDDYGLPAEDEPLNPAGQRVSGTALNFSDSKSFWIYSEYKYEIRGGDNFADSVMYNTVVADDWQNLGFSFTEEELGKLDYTWCSLETLKKIWNDQDF